MMMNFNPHINRQHGCGYDWKTGNFWLRVGGHMNPEGKRELMFVANRCGEKLPGRKDSSNGFIVNVRVDDLVIKVRETRKDATYTDEVYSGYVIRGMIADGSGSEAARERLPEPNKHQLLLQNLFSLSKEQVPYRFQACLQEPRELKVLRAACEIMARPKIDKVLPYVRAVK